MSPSEVTSQTSYNIPANQQAAVFSTHSAPLESRTDWPVVQPADLKPGEILVRIVASGVCHTDLHIWKDEWPAPSIKPLVGGHEGAGYVAAIGKYTDTELKVGDAVGLKWMADSCLSCEECRKGNESSCAKIKNHGYTVGGCFAQFVVSWAKHVTPIPKGMSLFDASPILCAGVTVYKALKTANLTTGESVVITGAGGGLGHLAIQYARNMGFDVIAVDTGADKQKLCESLGANHFVDFKMANIVDEINKLTNGGAHAAIVVASGAAAYNQAIDYLRPNGALVAVGLPKDAAITAPIFTTVVKSLRILGSYVGSRQDSIEALKIAAAGHIKTTYHVEPLTALPTVYEKMEQATLVGKVVLDCQ